MAGRSNQLVNGLASSVPSPANIERVNSLILQPLLQWPGVDAFSKSVVTTSDMLHRGLLQNIHDVEIMLTVTARVRIFHAYLLL